MISGWTAFWVIERSHDNPRDSGGCAVQRGPVGGVAAPRPAAMHRATTVLHYVPGTRALCRRQVTILQKYYGMLPSKVNHIGNISTKHRFSMLSCQFIRFRSHFNRNHTFLSIPALCHVTTVCSINQKYIIVQIVFSYEFEYANVVSLLSDRWLLCWFYHLKKMCLRCSKE